MRGEVGYPGTWPIAKPEAPNEKWVPSQ
jgi:hypothetical protein